jgi:hypothetical protein
VCQVKDYTTEQWWGSAESFAMYLWRTRFHHRGSGGYPDSGFRLSRGLVEKAPIANWIPLLWTVHISLWSPKQNCQCSVT